MGRKKIKQKFFFGCSSSATQIEGAYNIDGKGLSIWDYYSDNLKIIKENGNPHDACNSYFEYKKDVKLLKELGCNAYRFSIAWTRIIPDGIGSVNQKGLDYYDSLINECLANRIEPMVTLFHWDMPLTIYKSGSWFNKEIVEYFRNYCEIVVSHFSKKVKFWTIINEPQCLLDKLGGLDPNREYTNAEKNIAYKNILLANATGVEIVHKHNCFAVSALVANSFVPKDDKNKDDIFAARNKMLEINPNDFWGYYYFALPMIKGEYPEIYGEISNSERMLIKNNTYDYIGLNIYYSKQITVKQNKEIISSNKTKTLMDWPVEPKCIYWSIKFNSEIFNKPVIITENGISVLDKDDKMRENFIEKHLEYLQKTIEEGIDVRGYFYWSLMDNFEWFDGYTHYFGLTKLDRSKKKSFYKYKELIKKFNGGDYL